jgi:hypothetical protein
MAVATWPNPIGFIQTILPVYPVAGSSLGIVKRGKSVMGGSVGCRGRSVVGTSNAAAKKQRDHYEKIHREYAAHYYDQWSMEHRDRFINAAIF